MKTKVLFALLLAACAVGAFAQSEPVAVVVPASSSTSSVSLQQLRDMFQCERTAWPSGERVALFSRPVNTPEHDAMLRAIYRMGESEYKQFWVMKQMRGESLCRVTELPSKGMTMEALRSMKGGLALIRQSDVTAEMKVLAVNGKKPGDAGYPLQ